MTRKEYEKALRTPQWRRFRDMILSSRGCGCEKHYVGCLGTKRPEIHHPYYIEGHMPWEYDPDDLMVLCHSCHQTLHRRLARTMNLPELRDESGRKIGNAFECPRCHGRGFIEKYDDFCGGICFKCQGTGITLMEISDPEDVKIQAAGVWTEIVEKGMTEKFESFDNVLDWLMTIHGLKEEEPSSRG